MKTHLAILPFLIGSSVGLANSEADISAIVAMSGCHEVGFDFQEFENQFSFSSRFSRFLY